MQRPRHPEYAAWIALLTVLPGTAAVAAGPFAALPATAALVEDPPRFDILEYRVLGNTKLPQADVERAVYAHLGPQRTIHDVEAARENLERTYHDAGFGTVFVDVPEQGTGDGVVRLQVTEGRLTEVRVTGARYFSQGRILAALPALQPGSVPHLPEIQEQLAAVNRATPDRAVTPVLRPGSAPGTVEVELKVKDELPLHASIELNDRYTVDTTTLRATVALSYDNLFDRQHSASLMYQTAPEEPSELSALVATYTFRPQHWPEVPITLYAVDSNTDVATFGTLGVLGNGQIFGVRATRPLPEQGGLVHSLSFGLEYKDFLEDILLAADAGLQTPVSYLNWPLLYSGLYRAERSTTAFNAGVNFGIRGLANDSREFAEKRYRGEPNYFYLRAGVQHTHTLPHEWQVYGRVTAQASAMPLVSNEEFAIGGVESVRGYLESNDLGDSGFSGSLELRSQRPATWIGLPPGSAYAFAFYDAGVVSIVDPLPDQARRVDLASVGLGLRAQWIGFALGLDWAYPLVSSGTVLDGDSRTHFSVRYGF